MIAFSGDPIAAPKVASDFAKAHEKFVILGGAMARPLGPERRRYRALPSLDELRARSSASSGAGDQDCPGGQRRRQSRRVLAAYAKRARRRKALRNLDWFEPIDVNDG